MLELLNGLTLNAALAIVGSVVTIVLGVFGYLMKARSDQNKAMNPSPPPFKAVVERHTLELDKIHSRVSSAKDDIATIQSEMRVFENLVRNLEKQLSDHEKRDIEDFKAVNAKSDKLMDILIQVLQDDKL